MKKVIKIVLWVLLVIIVVLCLIGLLAPPKYEVVRKTHINAARSVVWEEVNLWKNNNHWSPWYKKDTAMKITISDNDGTVGATYRWESSEMGKGTQKILELKPMDYRKSELAIEGWGDPATIEFSFADSAGGTNVTWRMSGEWNFIGRIFGYAFNMKSMLGKDFDEGLANMKAYCEKLPAPAAPMPAEEHSDSAK